MKKVTITIVPSCPAPEAELAMRAWARAHPELFSRLSEGDLEVMHIRGCAEDGSVIAKKQYRVTLEEADAALVSVPGPGISWTRSGISS